MGERSNVGVSSRRRHAQLMLTAVVSAAVGAVLYRFPPDRYGFYPQCPIHQYTGLLCPGCGATRAMAALLHGHVAEAMHWNALVVVLLPVVVAYGTICYRRATNGLDLLRVSEPALVGLFVAVCAFGVARNLM